MSVFGTDGSVTPAGTVGVELSVVSPFLDERECLPAFCDELRTVLDSLGVDYEVILVDDGSTDGSVEVLAGVNWPQCRILSFIQNAGHQNALDAGLKESTGDWVVTMDADLQHPPECIQGMMDLARDREVDIVYAVRTDRSEENSAKRFSAAAYYLLASALSGIDVVRNAADFRLMSRRVVDVVNAVPGEKVFRLLLPSLGFPFAEFEFRARPRAAGSTKFSMARMLTLALSGSVSFSSFLLRWVSFAGLLTSFLALLWFFGVLASAFLGNTVPGWASVMSVLLLLGGLTLFSLGLLGEYLARIYDLLKDRPPYVIARTISLESPKLHEGLEFPPGDP